MAAHLSGTSECPQCGSGDLHTENNLLYKCNSCGSLLMKHKRRSNRGTFDDSVPYLLPIKRPGLESVTQKPRSGNPRIIETE